MCLTVPGKIVTIFKEENLGLRRGKVDFGVIRKEVCTGLHTRGARWEITFWLAKDLLILSAFG